MPVFTGIKFHRQYRHKIFVIHTLIEFLKNTDTQLFLFLNGMHNRFFDVLMWWISYKFTWIPLYLFLIYLLWKKFGKGVFPVLISVAVLIFLSDQVSVQLFKNTVVRYRPCHNLLIKDLIHLQDGCGGLYGFVSSHAANTFALAMFLSLLLGGRKFTGMMFLWAALCSYSRIYLGVHYPADILAGALLGCITGAAVFRLFSFTQKKISV